MSPLAIAVECGRAGYDSSKDVDGDSEQVGMSSSVSEL